MKEFTKTKFEMNVVKFITLFLVFSVLLWVSTVLTDTAYVGHYFNLERGIAEESDVEEDQLLPTGFDEESCVSRHQLPLYWRGVARKPSPHLITKLRSYEARHRRCGPHTSSYNQTVVLLQSDTPFSDNSTSLDLDCKYIVWISFEGMGNKMLTLASAFLYALLTDRVLLADRGVDIPDLFCEPFPEASLFVPTDFPFTDQLSSFNQQSNQSYGNLLKTNSSTLQPYIYVHLAHDYDHHDELFYCDQHQTYLHSIPWFIVKSDVYFAPALFLIPSLQQELHALFPEKETVFHLLGRYLFRPTNSVWGLITRYYQAHLSQADVKVGIQVRVFDETGPYTAEQILSCTMRENILPQISQGPSNTTTTATNTTRVDVGIASLRSGYMERVRERYWENPTERGEVVSVSQPSHEEYQQTGKPNHDRKALAEIYLLSLMDEEKLVTSGWSTFGYVAQALAGVKPWILYRPQNKQTVPDPPCGRGVYLEPCYHYPPHVDCETRRGGVDLSGVVPHVRPCEDFPWGIKLF